MMAARMGWAGYGDKQYAAHVLRYYPFGHAFTAGYNHAIKGILLIVVLRIDTTLMILLSLAMDSPNTNLHSCY